MEAGVSASRPASDPAAQAAPGSGVAVFSVSTALVLTLFLLDRVTVVTSITQVRRNCNQNLGDYPGYRGWAKGGRVPFLQTRQNDGVFYHTPPEQPSNLSGLADEELVTKVVIYTSIRC